MHQDVIDYFDATKSLPPHTPDRQEALDKLKDSTDPVVAFVANNCPTGFYLAADVVLRALPTTATRLRELAGANPEGIMFDSPLFFALLDRAVDAGLIEP